MTQGTTFHEHLTNVIFAQMTKLYFKIRLKIRFQWSITDWDIRIQLFFLSQVHSYTKPNMVGGFKNNSNIFSL